jgi:hypothetical protein
VLEAITYARSLQDEPRTAEDEPCPPEDKFKMFYSAILLRIHQNCREVVVHTCPLQYKPRPAEDEPKNEPCPAEYAERA